MWVFLFYDLRLRSISVQCQCVTDTLHDRVPYADTLGVISDRWRCLAGSFSWWGVGSRPSLPLQRGNSFASLAGQASSCPCSNAGAPFNPLWVWGVIQSLLWLHAEVPLTPLMSG